MGRNTTLARNIVNYSCKLKKGEKVWIDLKGTVGMPLLKTILKEVHRIGAIPFVQMSHETIEREILLNTTEEQLRLMATMDCVKAKEMDAYIFIKCPENIFELAGVPQEKMDLYKKLYVKPVYYEILLPNTRWVGINYPSPNMAQSASMSSEEFKNHYYKVCNLDYSEMKKALEPLKELMEKTDKVHIVGNGTDISFSIKGMPAVICSGERNIPDGEIYTAPIKSSVNGVISYNAPSIQEGFTYTDIKFKFKDGKIIEATSNNTEKINKILDLDEGSRYIGEFALGVNPYIEEPINNILFDEKIMGSFHLTPGSSYDKAYNGNESVLHWDLICIQTPKYGGGEIYFDDVLIRKDGVFVLPQLQNLNPENLK